MLRHDPVPWGSGISIHARRAVFDEERCCACWSNRCSTASANRSSAPSRPQSSALAHLFCFAGLLSAALVELQLNDVPALRSKLLVTEPRSPLNLSAGILVVDAFQPSDPSARVTIRVLAARRAPSAAAAASGR
jgi:hypothetical protein